ncbi:hypothetical protein D3C73_603640 [compost metagenome]
MHKEEAQALCKKHMHRYVGVQMEDGSIHVGIVESVDDDNVYLAVPLGGEEQEQSRAFLPYYGYPYGQPYPYPGFGYPRRRFARQVLPLVGLLALTLLPYY